MSTKLDPTQKFIEFHANNPEFYDALVYRTREYIASTGSFTLGINMVMERARWDHQVTTRSADFKVDNNYAPYYARLIMRQESDLDGVFNLRKASKAEAYIDSLVAP